MAANPQTTIEVVLDDSAIRSQLDTMQSRFAASWTEIAAKINVARAALDAVISVGKGLYSMAMAADAVAIANRRATDAIQQYGGNAAQVVAQLSDYNSAIARKLGLDADDLIQMQGTLALLGVAPGKLEEATRATIGLAEATGADLDTAVRTVAKAMAGNVDALRKVGIFASSADDAMAKLSLGYEVAANRSDTFAVKTRGLAVAFGDVVEAAGSWIAQNAAINAIIANMSYSVGRLASKIAPPATGAAKAGSVVLGDGRAGPMRLTGEQEAAYAKYAEQDRRAAEKAAQIASRERERERSKAERAEETAADRKWQQMIRQGEYERDLREKHAAEMRKIEQEAFDRRVDIGWQEYDQRAEQIAERERQEQEFAANTIAFGVQSASGLFDALAEGAARGEEASQVIAKFMFSILRQLGGTLIALGTAAVAAGAASTAAPWTIPFLGGPAGVGAGMAMIAAGTLLSAGGAFGAAAMGVGGGGAAASAATAPRHSTGSGVDWANRAGADSSRGGRGATVINIEFNRPVTNPRRTARELADALAGIG